MASSMYLYGLTLQRATQITLSIHGQFSGTKQQVKCTVTVYIDCGYIPPKIIQTWRIILVRSSTIVSIIVYPRFN